MNKAGLAGAGLGALALVLAIVNFSRVSGALARVEESKGPSAVAGNNPSAGEPKGTGLTAEDRTAEIAWLKKETAAIAEDIRKLRSDIASGAAGTSPKPPPDGAVPLPLSPADVATVIDRILEQRWKDQKTREAEAKITMLERGADAEFMSLSSRMNLDDAQKAKVQAVLKSQVEGYGAVLRILPVPEDKQAQLDKVTKEAEDQLKLILNAEQFQVFKQTGGGWHGFNQKVDPKRDHTPQPPRSK